jgi:hypothetical protein
MPTKNIVLCSDGTGNTAIKNRGTNVYKLYEAVDLELRPGERRQVAFYDDGVGTGSMKILRILGGAFGYGFARNVRDLYTDLARVYRPGDSIYLFGFSRGAYTVRALGGMIATCGILDGDALSEAGLRDGVSEAYRVYRQRFRPERFHAAATRNAEAFRASHPVHQPGNPVRIAFIGVWDTVGAVGLPDDAVLKQALWLLSGFRIPWFKHYLLGDIVDRACHALAVDDERQTFHPILCDERRPDGTVDPRLDQVWFAGVHSNVGGGYPKHGMSLVTLDWMMSQARAAGLRFSTLDGDVYHEHRNVHDMLYDSRTGLSFLYRYSPRDLTRISTKHGIEQPRVHVSVFDRIALRTEGYAPGNVPPTSVVVGAESDASRLDKVRATVRTTLANGLPLDAVHATMRVRQMGYFLVLSSLFVLAGLFVLRGIALNGVTATVAALFSLGGLASLTWDFVRAHPIAGAFLAVCVVAGWIASWRARRSMQDRFADVWRPGVKDLRVT